MTEELQNLLDRIEKDGVEKAEASATHILDEAKKKADVIVETANKKAADTVQNAEREAQVFTERSKKSLEQAARDVILSVGDAISSSLNKIIDARTADALSVDVLKQMLTKIVEAYATAEGKKIDILVSEKDQDELQKFFMAELAAAARKNLEMSSDSGVVAGFTVSIQDDSVHHDFTQKAIAESLCQLVRPHLAEIVRSAVSDSDN